MTDEQLDELRKPRGTTRWDWDTVISLPQGGGFNLHIGHWAHPERCVLDGFETSFDAWAFCVAHGIGDPAAGIPPKVREWCNKPVAVEEVEPVQMVLL